MTLCPICLSAFTAPGPCPSCVVIGKRNADRYALGEGREIDMRYGWPMRDVRSAGGTFEVCDRTLIGPGAGRGK